MKAFPGLVFTCILGIAAGSAQAAWTKRTNLDSVRILATETLFFGDITADAIVAVRRDSMYIRGPYPGWNTSPGTLPGGAAVSALYILDNRCFAGTSKGKIFRKESCYSDAGLIQADPDSASILSFTSTEYLFAGTNKGIVRSTRSGFQWTAMNSGLPSGPVTALAGMGALVLAGTDSGIFATLNAGVSWSRKGMVRGKAKVRTLEGTARRILAATDSGIYRSADTGVTWTRVNGLPNSNVHDILGGNGGARLFAATDGGVYLSNDSGSTWALLDTGITSGPVYVLSGRHYPYTASTELHAGNDGGIWSQNISEFVPTSIQSSAPAPSMDFRLQGRRGVSFSTSRPSHVTLEAFTLAGVRAAAMIDERLPAGSHHRTFSKDLLPAGLYIYRLKADQGIESRLVPVSR